MKDTNDTKEAKEKIKHDEMHFLSNMITLAKKFSEDIEKIANKMILGKQELNGFSEREKKVED